MKNMILFLMLSTAFAGPDFMSETRATLHGESLAKQLGYKNACLTSHGMAAEFRDSAYEQVKKLEPLDLISPEELKILKASICYTPVKFSKFYRHGVDLYGALVSHATYEAKDADENGIAYSSLIQVHRESYQKFLDRNDDIEKRVVLDAYLLALPRLSTSSTARFELIERVMESSN